MLRTTAASVFMAACLIASDNNWANRGLQIHDNAARISNTVAGLIARKPGEEFISLGESSTMRRTGIGNGFEVEINDGYATDADWDGLFDLKWTHNKPESMTMIDRTSREQQKLQEDFLSVLNGHK